MKKILMITHHDLLYDDGDSTRIKKIGHLLEDSFQVEYLGLSITSKKEFYKLFRMIYRILRNDFDYIYCCNQRYIVFILWIMKIFKRYKLVYDALLTWQLQKEGRLRAIAERVAGKCADYIITASELAGGYFRNSLIIPTLVDTDIFKVNTQKRLKIRAKYGILENDIIVGLVGGFNNEYNRPLLEYLYQNIDKFDSRIKFLVIGNISSILKNRRIIYTGYVEDYVGYLSTLDALLVYRTIPTDVAINRIVEAMAMGIPVFANPVAGRTMESNAKDIFVFSDQELPSEINRIVANGLNIGMNERKIAEEYYSEKNYKQKLLEFLNGEEKYNV